MKRRLNRTFRILPLALIVATASTIGIGYAAWNFSQRADKTQEVTHTVTDWEFTWTDQSLLSDDMYNLVETFTYAINNTGTTQGKAFQNAWEAGTSTTYTAWNHDYIGSMINDSTIAGELEDSFAGVTYTDGNTYSSYTIFIKYLTNTTDCKNDGSENKSHTSGYDIFLYEGSSYSDDDNDGYVQPIYKTCVTKQSNGKFVPTQSYKGKAQLVTYKGDSTSSKNSIDTGKFTIIS